jgi:hypothetical protein
MPKLEYQDGLIEVRTGVDLAEIGQSVNQTLSDGITIKINSPTGHVIQFCSRFSRWLDGPQEGQPVAPDDIPGTSASLQNLEWKVDSASKPDPYYDTGGACVRTQTHTTVGDQPDVDQFSPTELAGWDSNKGELTAPHRVANLFCAASIVIANNKVQRVVAWTRTGGKGAAFYKVKVETIDRLSAAWIGVLQREGYHVPQLA